MTQLSKSPSCCPELSTVLDAELFKALGDPRRLAILCELASGCGEKTVSEVGTCCPIDLSVVSRHLTLLRKAGVVQAHRRGKQVHYRVRTAALARTLRRMADALERCCPPDEEISDE